MARWNYEQGKQVIEEWRQSGLSMSAFARERGLNTQRLYYWRERVEGGGSGASEGRSKLVPGVVVGVGGNGVSVELTRGVVVEAATTANLDVEWLVRLVVALERV